MLSSLALDASSGSVTTSLTSNSRALITIKHTFSVAIDKSGGFFRIGWQTAKFRYQLAAVLAIPALHCTQDLSFNAESILLTQLWHSSLSAGERTASQTATGKALGKRARFF